MRTFRGGLLIGLAVAVAVAAVAITYERYDTRTLKRTIRRGEVLCGVNAGLPGFSIPDDKGNWTGFDVAFSPATRPGACRARLPTTCISRRWLIMKAKDSWCRGRETSIPRWRSTAAR